MHESFDFFLNKDFFDQNFINEYHYRILLRTKDFFARELDKTHQISLVNMKRIVDGEIEIQKASEAREVYVQKFNKEKFTGNEHLISYSRALFCGLIGDTGVTKNCAKAVAFVEDKSMANFIKEYDNEIRVQRRILVQMVFERYPEETKNFTWIKSLYQIKNLLQL